MAAGSVRQHMSLKREIKQKRPFRSVQEEVVLAMIRTADQLAVSTTEVLREANLSLSQYNVLRILRGAGDEALACGEIAERMIRRDPDLTRLLDKLEARGLVTRSRGTTDRRVVRAAIAPEGLQLLESLDAVVDRTTKQTLKHMSVERLELLLELLDETRAAS